MGLSDDREAIPYRVGLPETDHGILAPVPVSLEPQAIGRNYLDYRDFWGVSFTASVQKLPIQGTSFGRRRDLCSTEIERMSDLSVDNPTDFTIHKGGSQALDHVLHLLVSSVTPGQLDATDASYGKPLLRNNMNGPIPLKQGEGSLIERTEEKNRNPVHRSTPAHKIVRENRTARRVEAGNGVMEADAVVCANTATTALKLRPNRTESSPGPLSTVTTSGCRRVRSALQKRLFPQGWYAIGPPPTFGPTMTGFADSSNTSLFSAPAAEGLIQCFSFWRHAFELNAKTDQDVIKILVKDLPRWAAKMADTPCFTEMFRYHAAVCLALPGRMRAMEPLRWSGILGAPATGKVAALAVYGRSKAMLESQRFTGKFRQAYYCMNKVRDHLRPQVVRVEKAVNPSEPGKLEQFGIRFFNRSSRMTTSIPGFTDIGGY